MIYKPFRSFLCHKVVHIYQMMGWQALRTNSSPHSQIQSKISAQTARHVSCSPCFYKVLPCRLRAYFCSTARKTVGAQTYEDYLHEAEPFLKSYK